jgi:hypothetical protein
MFMNAAPATAQDATEPDKRDPQRGRLLGLVRQLIDYGRDLVAALQARNTPNPPLDIAHNFGGVTLALIITRITRGLMIAAALERRLLHPRPRPPAAAPRPTAQPRANRAPRRTRTDEESEELLGALPSAREIAARIRGRRPGAVIIDICRDLGINGHHPLWREVCDAIMKHGGNMMKLIRISATRGLATYHLPIPPEDQALYDRQLAAFARPP